MCRVLSESRVVLVYLIITDDQPLERDRQCLDKHEFHALWLCGLCICYRCVQRNLVSVLRHDWNGVITYATP